MQNTTIELNHVEIFAQIDIHLLKIPKRFQKDNEDTRQEIFVAILERSRSFDPALSSWPTFVNRTIRKFVRNFLLSKRWQKNCSPESFEDLLTEQIPRINEHSGSELGIHEKSVFAEELQEIISAMPQELAECCDRLRHYTFEETAEILNVPKTTLHHRFKRIQRILIQKNMAPNNFVENENFRNFP